MLENNEICSSNESFRSTDVAKNTRVVSVSRLHLSYSSVHLLVFFLLGYIFVHSVWYIVGWLSVTTMREGKLLGYLTAILRYTL